MESQSAKQRILERAFVLGGLYGLGALTIGRLAEDLQMSKAGVHGLFGSKEALQLATVRRARERFVQDIVQPAEAAPEGVPRLWAMTMTLTIYSSETGLHGGDFWVTVANEYDSRSGPVRDAIEASMSWWRRRLESLISAGVELGQLTSCDPAQLAFEFQALFDAGGHMYRLHHDPKAPMRTRTGILHRLEQARGPQFPSLKESDF